MVWWFPESTGSQTSSSTIVVVEMTSDVRMFSYMDLQPNIANSDMVLIGNTENFYALRNGYIRATSVEFSDVLTSGVISLVLTRATPPAAKAVIADTRLNLTINVANQPRQMATVGQEANFAFSAGDILGFQVSTNGTLLPIGREINSIMFVEYT